MDVAIYISVICVVAVGLIVGFVLMQKKDKKRYDKLQNQAKQQQPLQEIPDQPQPVEKTEDKLEDFYLEEEKKPDSQEKISLNPFDDDDEDDRIFDLDEFDDYEQFLRDEMQVGDEEEVNTQQPYDAEQTEFDSSQENLTKEEEDFIKAEIMNRKKYEDE